MANKPKDVKDKNTTPEKFEIVSIDMIPKDMTITPGIVKGEGKELKSSFDVKNAVKVETALSTMLGGVVIRAFPGGKDEHMKQINKKQIIKQDDKEPINYTDAKEKLQLKKTKQKFEDKKKQKESENDDRGIG